jgi:DNA-binding response OmpR family regulator
MVVESIPVPEPESDASTQLRILVADDEPAVANLFQRELEKAGYQVTVVNQGSRVLTVTRQIRPDLITLDLLMDVDGLSILRQLKADPETAGIPVVVVSIVSRPEEGLALGATDYLVKPLDEGRLLRTVQGILAQPDKAAIRKILVVDDEIDIVGWLKHALTHYGFEVAEAYDGVQALKAVEEDPPDLILMDLKMPRMDGRTAIRRLRQQEVSCHIPIVVLSAQPVSDALERVQMLDMGVREFLHKPVTAEYLVAEVERHLSPRE